MPIQQKLRRVLLSKPLIIIVAAVTLYTLAGFLLIPALIKHYVPIIAQKSLNRQASVSEVRFNPYLMKLELRGFFLQETDGRPILAFQRLLVDFEMESLNRLIWTFKDIILEEPNVYVEIDKEGRLNLAELAGPGKPPLSETDKDAAGPPRLLLKHLQLQRGEIHFADQRGATEADVTLQPVSLELNNLALLPERTGTYVVAAEANDGGSIKWSGEVSLEPVAVTGTIELRDLQVKTLWEFMRDQVLLEEPKGTMGLSCSYRLGQADKALNLVLEAITLSVKDMTLKPLGDFIEPVMVEKVELQDGRLDLLAHEVDIPSIDLVARKVSATVDQAGNLNWNKLIAPTPAQPAGPSPSPSQEPSPPWKVKLGKLEVAAGDIQYGDRSRNIPIGINLDKLHVELAASVEQWGQTTQLLLSDAAIQIEQIALKPLGQAEEVLRLAAIQVADGSVDLNQHTLSVGGVQVKGGRASVVRGTDGNLNWVTLFGGQQEGAMKRAVKEEKEVARAKGQPWKVLVRTFDLQGMTAEFVDQGHAGTNPVTVEDLAVNLVGVTGDFERPLEFEVGFKVKEGGQASLKGKMLSTAPQIEASYAIDRLTLVPLKPYLSDVGHLDLASGTLSTSGEVRYGMPDAGANLSLKCAVKLNDFLINDSLAAEQLVGVKVLDVPSCRLTLEPNHLEIPEIKLTQPNARVFIEPDHTVNFAKVMDKDAPARETKPPDKADKPKAPAATQEKSSPFPLRIDRVSVENGFLDFSDMSLKPRFAAKIHQLKGWVKGISLDPKVRTQVQLEGRVDDYGLAKINGQIQPFSPQAFTDITMVFRNIAMDSLSPYSGKFAGYQIKSGKLSLDLQYKIKNSQLVGENTIIVDQLTLGEKVEGPDAPNLPLELAVALLKDANGRIDIGLPVRGDLQNPEFSFGQIIWKALSNLITKVVTAPFRALASQLGIKGENLDTVHFEPGSSELLPPEREKLLKVAQALTKRPQLKVKVQGYYSQEVDGEALRSLTLRKQLASLTNAEPGAGGDPGPVDFSDKKTRKALERLFRERFSDEAYRELRDQLEQGAASDRGAEPFPPQSKKKGNVIKRFFSKIFGALKKTREEPKRDAQAAQPPAPEDEGELKLAEELYARLVAAEKVDESRLQELGTRRAKAVADELAGPAGLGKSRVTVAEPATVEGQGAEQVPVKLSLEAS